MPHYKHGVRSGISSLSIRGNQEVLLSSPHEAYHKYERRGTRRTPPTSRKDGSIADTFSQ